MKKSILTIAAIFVFVVVATAQTITENYIKTTTFKIPIQNEIQNISTDDRIESTTYFDGLGRSKQTVAVQAGGDKEDLVTPIEYDAIGRQPKEYLPMPLSSGIGTYRTGDIPSDLATYYPTKFSNDFSQNNTPNPYSEMRYENSPLNRVIEQGAPGEDWRVEINSTSDHTIKFSYLANTTADQVQYFYTNPINITVSGSIGLGRNGHYPADELYKNVTKDENWNPSKGPNHTTQEFTDKLGRVVLKRTFENNVRHDTYYVYDDYGNLSYVLSPEGTKEIIANGITQQILDDYCYQYKYDYRNRLTEKKIPGKGWEYILYDKLDRPVLTQDANLRANDEWLFTKYDAFGRVTYTGIYTSPFSINQRVSEENALLNQTNPIYNETRVTTANPSLTGMGQAVFYSNDSYPSTSLDVLTINYYDDYAGETLPTSNAYGETLTTSTKSLATVSKVRVLGTTEWITTLTGYDQKGRPIYVYSENTYLNTIDESSSLLGFTGITLESTSSHQIDSETPIVTKDYFTYDHMERLLTHKQKIDQEPAQLIAENTYDELGQLIRKDVGGETLVEGYTDVTNADVTVVGYSGGIKKDIATTAWDGGAKTKGEIMVDGGISFQITVTTEEFRVGLIASDNSSTNWGVFDYAIDITPVATPTGLGTSVKVIAGGVIDPGSYGDYQIGDVFSVERLNGNILYKKNGTTFYTLNAIVPIDDTFVGKIGLKSPLARTKATLFASNIDTKLQRIDYTYNVRGWLKGINDQPALTLEDYKDIFSFYINYNDPEHNNTPLYNGNISETFWKTKNDDDDIRGYAYSYDALNRITGAASYKGATTISSTMLDYTYNVNNITYDRNGNILTLERIGITDVVSTPFHWDDLTYTYNGNQLSRVVEPEHGEAYPLIKEGFNDLDRNTPIDYTYDSNGNMLSDTNKGITSITYNHLNLPKVVTIAANPQVHNGGTIEYKYDATGVKLAKIFTQGTDPAITTLYAGNFMYNDANAGTMELQFFNHPEGYVQPVAGTEESVKGYDKEKNEETNSAYAYVFQYKDHLGNVRLSYSDSDLDGSINPSTEIIEESNYYPFGLKQKGYNNTVSSNGNSVAQKYGFNGKEEQNELGLNYLDFGARNYDPALGRWMNIDPLAEDMRRHSPYNYAYNNPIYFMDPDGMAPIGCPDGDCGRVLAVFYHGGPTGGGKETNMASAGGTGQMYMAAMLNASNADKDFEGTIIAPGVTSSSGVATGLDYINENYQEGDQVILYGYSYGVDVAVDLSEQLKEAGINVDLLVTVDGSDGPLQNTTVNTDIPDNVSENVNIYQTDDSGSSSLSRSTNATSSGSSDSSNSDSGTSNSPGSNGGPNTAVDPSKTNVNNINKTGKGINHGNIQQKSLTEIWNAFKKTIDNEN
jgi:RHS repeat-associated protein